MAPEIRRLVPDELNQLLDMRRVTFQDTSDYRSPAQRERHLERLPFTYGLFVGSQLASAVVMYPFQMHFAGKELALGGLGSVQTPPEFRRRGYVQALLKDGLERLRAQGVGFCMEYPFDTRFYARYGWQGVWSRMRLSLPPERLLERRTPPDALRLDPHAADTGTRLAAIHGAWMRQYSLPLTRAGHGGRGWSQIVLQPWEAQPPLIYLLENAYCILRIRNENGGVTVKVMEYAFGDPRGRDRLWTFLGTFSGQADRVILMPPADEPLLMDLQEYLQPVAHQPQVRVVDVKAALEQLSSPVEQEFSLAVRDDFCDWNARTFHVRLHPERVQVEPGSERGAADLTIDIRALAALLCGSLRVEAGFRAGGLEGHPHVARALAALAGTRVAFAPELDYF